MESLPRDVFQILSKKLHFTDVVALLSVSKTVRENMLRCAGAWSTISFAVLPVRFSEDDVDENEPVWNFENAVEQMVSFLSERGVARYVLSLSCSYKPLSDAVMARIWRGLPNLRELSALAARDFCCFSDIVRRSSSPSSSWPPLRVLELGRTGLSSHELGVLLSSVAPSLEELILTSVARFDCPKLPRLRTLELSLCGVELEVLCARYPGLTRLTLWGCHGVGNFELIGMQAWKLTHLNVGCNEEMTDAALARFITLTELHSLTVSMCRHITGAGLQVFVRASPKLRVLLYSNCPNVHGVYTPLFS